MGLAWVRDRWRELRVLLAFGFRAGPAHWSALFAGAVIGPIADLVMTYSAKLLTDAVLERHWEGVIIAASLAAASVIVGTLCGFGYVRLIMRNTERASEAIDRHLVSVVARIPGLQHFERPDYADQMALLRSQRHLLAEATNMAVLNVRMWVALVGGALLLFRLHPLLVLLPLFGLGSFWTGRKANLIQQRVDESNAELGRLKKHLFVLATTPTPGKEVRVFRLADELIERRHVVAGQMTRESARAAWKRAALEVAGSLTFAVGYMGSLVLVLVRATRGEATPGDVVLAAGLAAGMNSTLGGVIDTANHMGLVLRAARRYLWLTDYAHLAHRVPANPERVPVRLLNGITLQRVSFRYPGAEVPTLHDVSLHLPAGAVVALVGENGAGKTTIVKLLSRFYEPDKGAIYVDGIDLQRFDIDEWRARLSAGYQDFCRFEFLVRETVGVGDITRITSRPALEAALSSASASDMVAALPQGLETQLGKAWAGGVELSGGQWQKLALGRAMMRESPLVIAFDEPTSALDAQTEHALFEQFATAARGGRGRGAVTLLVSHRFSTVRMADLIVVLDNGRVLENGTHAELMAHKGLYAELYALQARAYI